MEKKNKRQIVYDYLLEGFVFRQFQAGDRINIKQIAETCNVSETPVREALRELEGDGYVRLTQNQGAFAIGINRNEISQLVQVKGVLEGFATRLALDYLNKDDFKYLYGLNDQMKVAMENNDKDLFSKLNMDFHTYLESKCGNETLAKSLDNLWRRWVVTRQVFFGTGMRMQESYNEHIEILKLAENRDFDQIELAVRYHKFRSAAYLIMNPS